jgi:predicted ATP-dependent Lon-type protease
MWTQDHILACLQFMELSPLIRGTLMPQFVERPNATGNHCPKITIMRILEGHVKMLEATLSDSKTKFLATAAFALRGRKRVKALLAQLSFRTLTGYFQNHLYNWIYLTGN